MILRFPMTLTKYIVYLHQPNGEPTDKPRANKSSSIEPVYGIHMLIHAA